MVRPRCASGHRSFCPRDIRSGIAVSGSGVERGCLRRNAHWTVEEGAHGPLVNPHRVLRGGGERGDDHDGQSWWRAGVGAGAAYRPLDSVSMLLSQLHGTVRWLQSEAIHIPALGVRASCQDKGFASSWRQVRRERRCEAWCRFVAHHSGHLFGERRKGWWTGFRRIRVCLVLAHLAQCGPAGAGKQLHLSKNMQAYASARWLAAPATVKVRRQRLLPAARPSRRRAAILRRAMGHQSVQPVFGPMLATVRAPLPPVRFKQ